MSEKKTIDKKTKAKPKHQPYGLTILHEDRDIIVVDKINGLLTVGTGKGNLKTAHSLLNNYVQKGNSRSKSKAFIVNPIDKETSGIVIFAKSEKAKKYLQTEWNTFNKKYLAVITGTMPEMNGSITSFLQVNKGIRVYSVEDKDSGKPSKTTYKTLQANKRYSLLELELHTDFKHQILVHLSENDRPVLGDNMYGEYDKGAKRLALHSCSLTIKHPFSKKKMTFETEIPDFFKALVKIPTKKLKKDAGEKKISKKQKAKNKLAKGHQ
ncbi:RluA family pseudouridine synthase [Saccharicrinis aurantiacus]|uniref:RluA family pseudouridine synthase n=1 Tax=Saccharicrinis aurantiacus TaxID=1849719 RepID=UPI0024928559|nr:RluA family pseudouridine synthase [Saccharicrinis aurantiacus]